MKTRIPPIVGLLVLARFLGMAATYFIWPFLSLLLSLRLGLSPGTAGGMLSVLYIGSTLGTLSGGILADHFGVRRAILLGLLLEGVALGLLLPPLPLPASLAVLMLLGFADGSLWPPFSTAVGQWVEAPQRPSAYALLNTAVNAGATAPPLLAGLWIQQNRQGFSLATGAAIGLALLALLLVRGLPPRTEPAGATSRSPLAYWHILRQQPVFRRLFLSLLPPTAVYALLTTLLPVVLLQRHQLSIADYGLLMTASSLFMVVLQWPLTVVVYPRLGSYRALLLANLLLGAGFLGFLWERGPLWLALGFALVSLGEILQAPAVSDWVSRTAPAGLLGRHMAAIGLSWALGGVFGPVLGGALWSLGGAAALWGGSGILCLLGAALLPRTKKPGQV